MINDPLKKARNVTYGRNAEASCIIVGHQRRN